jgi:hypothetical protein
MWINKGCKGKSVKCILCTCELDPTDNLLNLKDDQRKMTMQVIILSDKKNISQK